MNKSTDLIGRKPNLVAADLADAALLLDVDSGYFFQMNPTASEIWRRLSEPCTFAELCTSLAREYGVEPDSLTDDVQHFVAELSAKGLLTVTADQDRAR